VLAGDRLVVTAGRHLLFVTKDGQSAEDVADRLFECQGAPRGDWSPPVADSEGNVYVLGSGGLCSVTSTGLLRWAKSGMCSAVPGGYGELPKAYQCAAPVVSSDGKVFAGAADNRVFALDAHNGKTLWSAEIDSDETGYRSFFRGGGGNRLLLEIAGRGAALLDAASGEMVGPMNFWCGAYSVGALGWMAGFECRGGKKSFATCDLPAAASVTGKPQDLAYVTAPGEQLVMYDWAVDADGRPTGLAYLTLYAPDGTVVAGPSIADGYPVAVGADGTIYGWMCDAQGSHVAAYARDLQRLWYLSLPGYCYRFLGGAVLDGDGVLYLTTEGEAYETTTLYAIQTRSPGLAASSWPHWRHDNRGTAWLDQPVRDVPIIDASATDGQSPRIDGAP
jgi:outer membrane protein assembly factor BamB